ncbi:uncharacterized protein N0V89_003171 [Didymosphaeria variabile]|uniref:Uncharacterized protein n=1 Tax=Didymosphaeria variabile TaxID=1932322 RepID=A0A9W8XT11_9PLEO|nr:uncharacterized protein N0V89_003171 [Didymosphaeria variabile]KAJ4358587.1 hypothetical protein N0V89_003171 [Didymosphaeria variabile]
MDLVEQLLRQWSFDTESLHNQVNTENLMSGDLRATIDLFVSLVRQLPQGIALFFVIDGAVVYEGEEFQDAVPVILSLIRLSNDTGMRASIKLLITSAPATYYIRESFEKEGLILNVDSSSVSAVASEERMVRELLVLLNLRAPDDL